MLERAFDIDEVTEIPTFVYYPDSSPYFILQQNCTIRMVYYELSNVQAKCFGQTKNLFKKKVRRSVRSEHPSLLSITVSRL